MSERCLLSLLGVAALMGLAAHPAAGQTRTELEARLARVRAAYAEVESTLTRQARTADSAHGWRRLRSGALVLEVEGPDAALGQRVVDSAWTMLVARFGTASLHDTLVLRLQRQTKSVRGDSLPPAERPVMVVRRARVRPGMPTTTPRVYGQATVETLAGAVTLSASEIIWSSVDTVLARWRSSPPRFDERRHSAERAYVQLATMAYEGGRPCLAGELRACARMLGLSWNLRDIGASYTPQERRVMVRMMARGYLPGQLRGMAGACLDLGDLERCDTIIAGLGVNGPLIPLDQDARGLLLVDVLELGGPAGFARLLAASDGPLEARLAATAGVPPDSLLARWRGMVLTSRPEQVGLTPGGAWAVLGWSLLLFGVALGSTRWR